MKIVLQQKRYTQNYFAEHTQFDFHLATWVVWTNTQFAIAGLFGPQKHVIVRNHHRSAWKLQTCSEHGNSRIASPKWLILGHTVMRKIRCGLFLPL